MDNSDVECDPPMNSRARVSGRPSPRPAARVGGGAPAVAAGVQNGLAALSAWAESRRPELEVTAQRRDVDGPMIDRALGIVRQFIIERGLILFGGLAIDYALRLRGSRIYPDDERPDFDVLSPRSVDDAYDLADILHKAGFEGVGAVRAIHVQTMKVRTSFVWVADIGYAPRAVFDRIPVIDYQGMRVVHPDFQRMDMHLAFCFPFSNPPLEAVYFRWKKDLKRFNLIQQAYPIVARARPAPVAPAPAPAVRVRLAVPVALPGGAAAERGGGPGHAVALHGFAAYAILRASLDAVARKLGVTGELVAAPRLSITFDDAYSVAVECPVGGTVHVASPSPGAVAIGAPSWFEPYMDVCPETLRAGDLAILATGGSLLAVSYVPAEVPGVERAQVAVVTPHYLLLLFLYEAHRAGDEGDAGKIYRDFYAHTLEIVLAASKLYGALPREKGDALGAFMASPFSPSVRALGTVNTSPSYIIKIAGAAQRLKDTPPPALGLDPGIANLLEGLPQNYYPASTGSHPAFDYDRNGLFRRAGQSMPAPAPALP